MFGGKEKDCIFAKSFGTKHECLKPERVCSLKCDFKWEITSKQNAW